MSRIVGIDLGTTNSVAAVIDAAGRPIVIESGGVRILPSVVALGEGGKLLVGQPAKNYLPVDPENAVRSVKRAMGSEQRFTLGEESYSPQQISALILRQLKATAEAALDEPIERAVITVPAYFSDAQRIATRGAGELAGLEVVRIINEPTAAALAFGAGRELGERVLVYDLGGGTFDVSIVQIDGDLIEVLATAGHNRLGGDDFDRRLVDYLTDRFQREHGLDLRADQRALARLDQAAERAKIHLSNHPFSRVQESFIATAGNRPLHLDEEVSRERFEQLIDDLLQQTLDCVEQALADAKCTPDDIDQVLLVGGSTRIPAVRERLEAHLGQTPNGEIHPDECVALGAAVQAGIIDGADVDAILVDVTAHSLGVETARPSRREWMTDVFRVIIPRNTVVPTERAERFSTVYDNQDAVEIVVYQGEEPVASENVLLGRFKLDGLPPAPAGVPEVVVTFGLSVDGILDVSAEVRGTDRRAEITIRDLRSKMEAHELAVDQAEVAALWEERGDDGDDGDDGDKEGDFAAVEGDGDDLDIGSSGSIVLSPATRALLRRADALAQARPKLQPKLSALTAEIVCAHREGDADGAEALEDELLDLLEAD